MLQPWTRLSDPHYSGEDTTSNRKLLSEQVDYRGRDALCRETGVLEAWHHTLFCRGRQPSHRKVAERVSALCSVLQHLRNHV